MDYIYFKIDYKVPYEVEAVRTIADSLAQAVRDNWSDEVNKPEFSEPLPCDRLEAWLENAVPDRMERVPDELADEEEIERFTEHIGFRFSPFSSREAELSAYKNRDGPLGVGLSVSMCSPGIPTPNWVPTLACTGPRTVLACSTSTIRCAGCSPSGRSRSPEHDRRLNVVRGKGARQRPGRPERR
jgi:hypothetical protein